MVDLTKLGPMDSDAGHIIKLTENLLNTRRKIEAYAVNWNEGSAAMIAGAEREQAALFAELHIAMDRLDAKTRS